MGARLRADHRRPRAGATRAGGHAGRDARRPGQPDARASPPACRTPPAGPRPGTSSTSTTCTCPSTAHISVVCVPATLATGGDDTAYLAGAGVMARLGTALGWAHYTRGWHVTCTAGAPAAAVAASVALGLTVEQTTHAIALAVPQAGGVQRAFGTDAKALQVGLAADAGSPRGAPGRGGRAGGPDRARPVDGTGRRRPGRARPRRARRAGRPRDQAPPLLLRAATPDQRAARNHG